MPPPSSYAHYAKQNDQFLLNSFPVFSWVGGESFFFAVVKFFSLFLFDNIIIVYFHLFLNTLILMDSSDMGMENLVGLA